MNFNGITRQLAHAVCLPVAMLALAATPLSAHADTAKKTLHFNETLRPFPKLDLAARQSKG